MDSLNLTLISNSHMDLVSHGSISQIESRYPGTHPLSPQGAEKFLRDYDLECHHLTLPSERQNILVNQRSSKVYRLLQFHLFTQIKNTQSLIVPVLNYCNSMEDLKSGFTLCLTACSNEYPIAINSPSLNAPLKNDNPTGNPNTFPAGTVI